MMKKSTTAFISIAAAVVGPATATSIAEINGNRYLSPLRDQFVTNVTGLVTASSKSGFYLRSTEPDGDAATSEGLFVAAGNSPGRVKVGDIVSLSGRVEERRSKNAHLYMTRLTDTKDLVVVSSGMDVEPLVLGVDTVMPPTRQFSSLDVGGIFGTPNAVHLISEVNPELDPAQFGLDFWESLMGELVTLPNVYQASRPNSHGDVWVRGSWNATGVNAHGGITILTGVADANPETIVVGNPLDESTNPTDSKMGDFLGNITGVVNYSHGSYRLLPLSRVAVVSSAKPESPAVSLAGNGSCRAVTIGNYNTENMAPNSKHMAHVIRQIVEKLRTPDLLFLQEVQDDSGTVNDGTTSANLTLGRLVEGIEAISGVKYDYADVEPVNNGDGGQHGGNIRCAYLYRPEVVRLHRPNRGRSDESVQVLDGPALSVNPGRIDVSNPAYLNGRKPLVAMWTTVQDRASVFFTVNVHLVSKGGSTSLHGNPRPPINKGVVKRTQQAAVAANFVAKITGKDPNARVIVAGDFNEFSDVEPLRVFEQLSGLKDLDDTAHVDPAERYTYLFEMNSQSLDHIYVSPNIGRGARYEHAHLNTWQSELHQASDHDPSVALLNLCGDV